MIQIYTCTKKNCRKTIAQCAANNRPACCSREFFPKKYNLFTRQVDKSLYYFWCEKRKTDISIRFPPKNYCFEKGVHDADLSDQTQKLRQMHFVLLKAFSILEGRFILCVFSVTYKQ